jgi:hypothetical protein
MRKTYGTPAPDISSPTETCLVFSDGPLELGWAHCGAAAEFVGEFFAGLAGKADLDVNEARHSIGYLTNELLENAVKFRAPGDVRLLTALEDRTFELKLSNLVEPAVAARFETLLGKIVSRDPGELLIETIEANAADPEAGGSGLGILTLMNDYGARLGWTFERAAEGDAVRVETYAALTLS